MMRERRVLGNPRLMSSSEQRQDLNLAFADQINGVKHASRGVLQNVECTSTEHRRNCSYQLYPKHSTTSQLLNTGKIILSKEGFAQTYLQTVQSIYIYGKTSSSGTLNLLMAGTQTGLLETSKPRLCGYCPLGQCFSRTHEASA
ncbi:hypothetical protein BaRGS_00002203 [Batillaria attramentaria]|uniref:Uncharacterized protein n=1 Tax=Batillaria attramentaria TaxID=370345 RepID=A0ABD0M5I2_9CAEN